MAWLGNITFRKINRIMFLDDWIFNLYNDVIRGVYVLPKCFLHGTSFPILKNHITK